MTKDSLKEIIREIVQEEIKRSLPQLLPQIMAEIFSSNQKTMVSESDVKQVSHPRPVMRPSAPTAAPAKKEYKIFTKNEKLNQALNETVVTSTREGALVSAALGADVSVLDNINNVPPQIANALTRDYSSFMKAVDKKKSGGSVGSSSLVGLE
jgi:hypothetical protein